MNIVTKEWDAMVAEVEEFWTEDVKPYFSELGTWAVGVTKNVIHDLTRAGQNALSYAGAQLKQMFELARTTVGQVMADMPNASFLDQIEEAVRRMGFSDALKHLAQATLQVFAHGFGSMIVSGLVSGAL